MPDATLALVRQSYAGPVEFGEDLMTIEVGDTVSVHRFCAAEQMKRAKIGTALKAIFNLAAVRADVGR